MAKYLFGAGAMFAIPPGVSNTPVQFGTVQESSVDFSASSKSLFGANRFAEAVAQGQMKVSGKAKFAKIQAATYNAIFFNETIQTGMNLVALNEMGRIPSGSEYKITVANSDKYLSDLGVIDADTGAPYTCVPANPVTKQYAVSAGIYTFADGDAGKNVYISYMYRDEENGKTIVLYNQPTGQATMFKLIFNGRFSGKQVTLILNACISSKLQLISTKLEDFSIPEFDFEASVDAGGVLGQLSTSE